MGRRRLSGGGFTPWQEDPDQQRRIEDVYCVRQTEKAIGVMIPDFAGDTIIWFPQSQIHDDSEVYKYGDHGTLIVSDWIAAQKGL